MSLFVLDIDGDRDLINKNELNVSTELKRRYSKQLTETTITNLKEKIKTHDADGDNDADSEDDGDYFGLPPPSVDISKLIDTTLMQTQQPKTKADEALDDVNERVNEAAEKAAAQIHKKRQRIIDIDFSDSIPSKSDDLQELQNTVENEMSACVLPGAESNHSLPLITDKIHKKMNKNKRAETKGEAWFNLPATEITEEIKNDLKILQMRSALDPKRFYKKNDLKVLPKYFQIGTVLHSPLDHYSERNVRQNKKSSLVEELLADEQFQTFNKRKYNELMARREKYIRRKAQMKMKKLKQKK